MAEDAAPDTIKVDWDYRLLQIPHDAAISNTHFDYAVAGDINDMAVIPGRRAAKHTFLGNNHRPFDDAIPAAEGV